jgi:hypothetical protein
VVPALPDRLSLALARMPRTRSGSMASRSSRPWRRARSLLRGPATRHLSRCLVAGVVALQPMGGAVLTIASLEGHR